MKSLKEYISEASLLDIDGTLEQGDYDIAVSQIKDFLTRNYKPFKYTISKKPNKDGKYVVNSRGCVQVGRLTSELVNELFVFGKCKQFWCIDNQNIKNLIGAPREVDEISCLWCSNLESLEGAPEVVKTDAQFENTGIKNLIGGPKIINGELKLSGCLKLESLEGCPTYVRRLSADGCKNLKSLKGAPKIVADVFNISDTGVESLEGSPEHVLNYWCDGCKNLKSFKGLTKHIDGSFIGDHCNVITLDCEDSVIRRNFSCCRCLSLEKLEGCPKHIGEDFYADNCRSLYSIVGLPKKLKNLYLSFCPNLKDLAGIPEKIEDCLDLHAGYTWDYEYVDSLTNCKYITL